MSGLLITPADPSRADYGGAQRSNLFLRALEAVDGDVDVVVVQDALPRGRSGWVSLTPTPRGDRGLWKVVRPLNPERVDSLAFNLGSRRSDFQPDPAIAPFVEELHRSRGYDFVVARYPWVAAAAGVDRLSCALALDVDDLETRAVESRLGQASGAAAVLLHRHRRSLRRWEYRYLSRFPGAIGITSSVDKSSIRGDDSRLVVIPNIPFWPGIELGVRGTTTKSRILVVGRLSHRPHIRGLSWFFDEVWPQLRSAVPSANIRVVGSGELASDCLEKWSSTPGVEVVGAVEDLAEEYGASELVVAPVLDGAGTNIKVLEAGAHGKAVVATPVAMRGVGQLLGPEHGILVAESAADFAHACVRLLSDRPLRTAIELRTGSAVREYAGPEVFQSGVQRLLIAAGVRVEE